MSEGATDECLRFAFEGERVVRAAAVLQRESPALENALRRGLPFLARRGVPIAMAYARAVSPADILRDITAPYHAVPLTVEPGGGRGALLLDGGLVALLLDGVFGGDGSQTPTLNPIGLTGPQQALVHRLVEGILRALSDALYARTGARISVATNAASDAVSGGAPIAYVVDVGELTGGRLFLLLPKEALLARETQATPALAAPVNPVIANTLTGVDLDVIVELARIPMKLSDILRMRVGETIPLDVGVDSPVTVRADDRVLLRGHPTTAGGRIAVRIEA